MFGQVEIEVEPFQPIALAHFDQLIDHHLREDNSAFGMVGMGQWRKALRETENSTAIDLSLGKG